MAIQSKSTQPIILACLFFCALGLYALAVWPGLNGIFLFDDFPNLENLKQISGTVSTERLGAYLAAFPGSPGRPIAALSFLINDFAWPSQAFGFKYTNVMIHLLNGVLVFGLVRQLSKASNGLPRNIFWPLLAMTAWLFHPLQLSAQMLVVQRMTLLSATFCFAGLWAYVTLLQKAERPFGALVALAALGTATILAVLSKENGALLPLFALVLNATLLTGLLQAKPKTIQRILLFGCAIPSTLVVASIVYMGTRPDVFASRDFDLHSRLITEAHILVDYLKQVFMPHITGSGIYHDDYPVFKTLFGSLSSMLCVALVLIGIASAFALRRRFALLSFAVLWFFAGHAMESTTLPLELYFEHRNYMPLLGPAMALTALPFLVAERLRKTAGLLLGIWLLLISFITYIQAPVWGNQAKMATFWAMDKPMSLRATYELADYHYDYGQPQQAFAILVNGYDRGIRAADLPFAALYTACWNSSIAVPVDLMSKAVAAAESAAFTHGTLHHLSKLRPLASGKTCPQVISNDQWWRLSDALLGNERFRHFRGYIYIERAKSRSDSNDFDNTLNELEAAYRASPSIELSRDIAGLQLSAGRPETAAAWLKKGLQIKQPFFESLYYDPKARSRQMLKDIE